MNTPEPGNWFTVLKKYLLTAVAVAFCCFHIYTAGFGSLSALDQRVIHWTTVFALLFMWKPRKSRLMTVADLILVAATVTAGAYLLSNWKRITLTGVGMRTTWELMLALVALGVTLEGTRRSIGNLLPMTALVFLSYVFVGPWLPAVIGHRGYSLNRVATLTYYGTEGIFGTAIGVSSTLIIVFLIFGSLLSVSGAGQFFIDLAFSVAGRWRGGSAKTALISSSLVGTISGSPAANVVTTGTFTIPLMKKDGYKPEVAAAVEAIASTGGQIMPPVMGAAAFVMAELIGVSYSRIAVAAVIPALLYYISVYMMVDIEAIRQNITGRTRQELPSPVETLKNGWQFLIPLGLLVYCIFSGWSVTRSVFNAILILMLIWLVKERFNIPAVVKKFVEGCKDAVSGSFSVVAACACAGIIVAVIQLTGLGLRVSSLISVLAGESLIVALVYCMIASLILGMGLPTTVLYLVLATLAAPTLVSLGVPVIAAHMFVFYFGCISSVTPPVALAAFAGAGIAQCSATKAGFTSFKLGASAYLVPYMFMYRPALLMIGSPLEIIVEFIIGVIAVAAISYGVEGWLFVNAGLLDRVLLLGGGILVWQPGPYLRAVGLGCAVVAAAHQYYRSTRIRRRAAGPAL